ERTLISAVVPPGAASVHTVFGIGFPSSGSAALLGTAASMSSLLSDFLVRSTSASNIFLPEIERLPPGREEHPLATARALRRPRRVPASVAHPALCPSPPPPPFPAPACTGGLDRPRRPALGDAGPGWSMASPLRLHGARRRALVEIDAIMPIVTGISIDDLV